MADTTTSDSNPTPPPPPPVTPPPPEADSSTLTSKTTESVPQEPKPESSVTQQEDEIVEECGNEEELLQQEADAKGNILEEDEIVEECQNEEDQNQQHQEQQELVSFRGESSKASNISDLEIVLLLELRILLRQTLKEEDQTEASIWGVPLLNDRRSNEVLLKFLRARDFKVGESHTMIKNTLKWRKEFNIDAILDEELGGDLDKVVFLQGFSKEGHPVCYNVYGEFQNKELYDKAFSSEERREKFLRWRIQLLERSVRNADFNPGGINTIFQVHDLKNSPGRARSEHRNVTQQALKLVEENYPECVDKQLFINVPWWFLAFYTMMKPFLSQRIKTKFVFARPSKSSDALFKYISPDQVPVQYGGHGGTLLHSIPHSDE